MLVNTYVDDDDEVLLLRPSYAMYRFYAEVAGAQIREIDFRPGKLEFPLEELLAAIQPATRAILIANPNNPTGTGTDRPEIEKILEKADGAAVLIDEAYFEFCGVTALPLLETFPNLFVSRTFSKVFGMAAMRMGCVFSQAANIGFLHKAQSPYSVNTLAALAARAAIGDRAYIESYVSEVLAARELLYRGFEKLGIAYVPSRANFVLFQAGGRAIEIRDGLRETGVLVRDRSYEIPGHVRVTVGTREQIAAIPGGTGETVVSDLLVFDMDGVLVDVTGVLPRGHSRRRCGISPARDHAATSSRSGRTRAAGTTIGRSRTALIRRLRRRGRVRAGGRALPAHLSSATAQMA